MARTRLVSRLQWVNGELAKTPYLMGETFTVANSTQYVALTAQS